MFTEHKDNKYSFTQSVCQSFINQVLLRTTCARSWGDHAGQDRFSALMEFVVGRSEQNKGKGP